MRIHPTFIMTVTAAALLSVTSCGGSDSSDGGTPVAVDDLPTGRYVVAVGDPSKPTAGKYHAAADGTRLLILADEDDRATQVYRRAAGQSWQAVPAASGAAPVTLLSRSALPGPAATLAPSSFAGSYIAPLGDGSFVRFSIGADGVITAGATPCKLSGRLATSPLPHALNVSLNASDCGNLPATSEGAAISDDDYGPTRLRLVADDNRRPVELWAFAE